MTLRFSDIAEIIKIIDASSCDELVLETGDLKLIVRRGETRGAPPTSAAHSPEDKSQLGQPIPPGVARNSVARPAETPAGHEVNAPMVGTFYRAPSPEASPFVKVGDTVKVDQPLCIIEVMKLMTTIRAQIAGRVALIAAENGELVQYGQTLFVIEPS